MLRRGGYILGLLFVAGCLAAYPLTWGRVLIASYNAPEFMVLVNVRYGGVYFATLGIRPQDLVDSVDPSTVKPLRVGLDAETPPLRDELYRVSLARPWVIPSSTRFPLWMPAAAVAGFMAWRWRRSRRRRGAGFPMERRGGETAKDPA